MNKHINETDIQREIERLVAKGYESAWGSPDLRQIAKHTLEINRLKKAKNAVIAGHVYQRPEILLGVSDFIGDSYKLAKDCANSKAKTIVFCGVKFMAETAKILSPEKTVLLPAPNAGCTLSDSIGASDIKKLKDKYPGAPVVTYINTSVAVKAESDCIVTSANAPKILKKLYKKHKRIIFLPDRLMGTNLAKKLNKKIGKEIILWDGTCTVHEHFDPSTISHYKRAYPGLKALAHTECSSDLISKVDFAGGTSGMLEYVKRTNAPYYLLITECGLGELARSEFPNKKFIPMCRLCKFMKFTTLKNVKTCLQNPTKNQTINVNEKLAKKALKALNKMFELAG
jgi:quinolinate synthase